MYQAEAKVSFEGPATGLEEVGKADGAETNMPEGRKEGRKEGHGVWQSGSFKPKHTQLVECLRRAETNYPCIPYVALDVFTVPKTNPEQADGGDGENADADTDDDCSGDGSGDAGM
ncbi:hypothetical protein AK812_SmicGene6801 [Symbiodinium microadriaticum]|uniref:Uncharacterized protein n=1 Tax=Symbiodinium microadriaticum TaxID=2951 RepID=A0A1Q9EQ72_SYMMI|nr:hypothetical protein AK812_SmicGene6801 [Symbiodinium microadriaticum]